MGRLVLPCALRGQYDLFVQARQAGALKLEAQAKHPHQSWPLLNHTHRIAIRTQNRVRKRQLIVKWERRWVKQSVEIWMSFSIDKKSIGFVYSVTN